MRNVRSRVGLVAVAFVLLACEAEQAQVGDAQVVYRVGSGSTTCAEVGIRSVRVSLLSSATQVEVERISPCTPDDQTVLVAGVAAGQYFVRVEGLDAGAQPLYTGTTADRMEVKGGRTNGPFTVVLDQIRPSMQVYFGFSEVGGCERFAVVGIQVVVYENGESETYNEQFGCVELTTGSGLLIDALSNSSTYDVRVRGLNDNDEYTYEYDVDDVQVRPGAPTEINAVLESCSGLCSEP